MLTPGIPRSAHGNSLSLTMIWYIARPPKNWPKARSPLLRRQRPDELHRPLDPVGQLVVVLNPFRGDHHPTVHCPARDVELPDVRFEQGLVAAFRAEADDQGILPDADDHVAVKQESDAAEQFLLLDALFPGQSS